MDLSLLSERWASSRTTPAEEKEEEEEVNQKNNKLYGNNPNVQQKNWQNKLVFQIFICKSELNSVQEKNKMIKSH